jgi:hypothetical protein
MPYSDIWMSTLFRRLGQKDAPRRSLAKPHCLSATIDELHEQGHVRTPLFGYIPSEGFNAGRHQGGAIPRQQFLGSSNVGIQRWGFQQRIRIFHESLLIDS